MQQFLREFIKATVVGISIFIVFLLIYYFRGDFEDGMDYRKLWWEFRINLTYSIAIYMANAYLFIYLLKKFDRNLFGGKRFLISIAGTIVVSLLALFMARFVHQVVLERMGLQTFWANQSLEYYLVSLVIATGVALVFYAFFYYKYRQEFKVKEQKIIAGTASAKFDALKNQLDPHFLFNSLNVLTSLIDEDPQQAQKFTTYLSKVYRYVLEQKNKDLIPVNEELRFAKTYIQLLKMRFEDSIVFEIPDESQDPEAKIVPLSLQLLLENAVKHNVVTSDRPLHIKVYEESGTLVVANKLQEKQVVRKSTGVGLQNIKQRYGLLTDRSVRIDRSASEFQVKLPMLSKQVSVMESQEIYIKDKRYQKAKERVEAIKGFFGNLVAYCCVIPFLIFLNYRTTDFPWAIFPVLGWGFGVTMHGLEAYGYNPLWGKRWEEKKIQDLMDKEDF